MLIANDDEARLLKIWIVKRLANISDADSDVLADYVLALLRADSPEAELRQNAIDNLEDFLHAGTRPFVQDIFQTIHSKSYLPNHRAPPSSKTTTKPLPSTSPAPLAGRQNPTPQVSASQASASQTSPSPATNRTANHPPSRKRGFQDFQDSPTAQDGAPRPERHIKQMRRGGGPRDLARQGPGRPPMSASGAQAAGYMSRGPQQSGADFASMQQLAGFTPEQAAADPMAAMMAMQQVMASMGMPPLPDLPNNVSNGTKARCRDYDTKGYCVRGAACPYTHGENQMVVPGASEEYDPNAAGKPPDQDSVNGHGASRGRGYSSRGRGDRGGGRGDRGSGRGDRGGGRGRGRSDLTQPGPSWDRSNTTVVIENIPEENFNEKQVRSFFAAFGPVVEVALQPYKRAATVRFDTYDGARAAYDSPKVIFDNRFVKVYWMKKEHVSSNNEASTSAASPAPPAFDQEKFEAETQAAQARLEARKAQQQETEVKRAALEKQQAELEKRQAEEKRLLLEKLQAKGISTPAAAAESKATAQTEGLRAKLRALEAEAKSLGLDPDASGSMTSYRGRGRGRGRGYSTRGFDATRGRGGWRGRGGFRGGAANGFNLDNRPRTVRIKLGSSSKDSNTGEAAVTSSETFDDAKEESLRQFVFTVGEPTQIVAVSDGTAQEITFKDRFTAEKLFHGSANLPGVGAVTYEWVAQAPSATTGPDQANTSGGPDGDADDAMQGLDEGDVDGSAQTLQSVLEPDATTHDVDYDVAEEEAWVS